MTGHGRRATLVATLLACLATTLVAPGTASAIPTPEQIVKTVAKLESADIDVARSFVADGQTLDRQGMLATFQEGSFRPIAREDGRVVGLVFEGTGTLEVRIPAGIETTSWQTWTDFDSLEQPFNAAWLRFSDLTLDDLQGEREWTEGGDADGSAFRIHTARQEMVSDARWTERAPHLLVDRMQDLYGGAEGGHLLADFRVTSEGPARWLSYYHNNRGALMEGETTSWYRARKRGNAPPLVTVLSSFGDHSAAAAPYDVAFIDLDMTFPTNGKAGRDITDTEVKADIGIVALNPYGIESVVLELEEKRILCNAETDRPRLKVRKVTDQDGNSLAAIHRKNRLFIPLAKKVARGEQVNLHIEYAGAVTQGIPTGPPDTAFSEIGPWAFYPRNPRTDRFATRISLHLPRFISGVAPGDLIEERKEKDGWHFVYEEPGGIRTLMVVVGDLVHSKREDEGSNPRVISWVPRHIQEEVKNTLNSSKGMLSAVQGIWGAYPYSTLHVVQTAGHPFQNWQIGADGAGGLWTCLPPGPQHPWESFIEQPSGMLVAAVISPPSQDIIESRFMDRYAIEGLQAGQVLQLMNLTRQWWGHMVPAQSYRDLWITEAIVAWTGLAWVSAALERAALKEKTRLHRDLAVEGDQKGVPLGIGSRADRQFLFDAWGRGPLLINALIDELGGGPFGRTMNTLVNRASGPGISLDILLESLETIGTKRTVELVRQISEGKKLPQLEVGTLIDEENGKVRIEVTQIDDPLPISLPVELVFKKKRVLNRLVQLDGAVTTVEWQLDEMPKRVNVDPVNMTLAASVKTSKLSAPAEETTE